MWPRRIITGFACSIRTVPTNIQPQPLSGSNRNLSSRRLSPRESPSKAVGPQVSEELPPLVLLPSTGVNYSSRTSKRSKGKYKMTPQGIQIPGLTLLNNLSPHAIAATSEGGFISAAAPQLQDKGPKRKENKKAKARRALAEVPTPRQYAYEWLLCFPHAFFQKPKC